MTAIRKATAFAALMAATMLATPLLAQEKGKSFEGSGEAPRAAPLDDSTKLREAKPIMPLKITEEENSRAAPNMDEQALVDQFTAAGHNADGSDTTVPPNDNLMAMIKAATGGGDSGDEDAAPNKSGDPALEEDEANRQVFGPDDRVQVGNTQKFPFTTFGYVEGKSKSGIGACSGTLIGPRTVLTAAHCLYNHEDGGWLGEMLFYPAINGTDVIPFGGFPVETTYVVQGYLKNYKGDYSGVTPWDLGIMILKDPIGEQLGWLGYANYNDLGDFNANIVGYPGDKPMATMWRSTCDVISENVSFFFFTYDCDTFAGSSGSSVYTYDPGSKQRIVLGVNIAQSPEANTAVRLNSVYYEWVSGLVK